MIPLSQARLSAGWRRLNAPADSLARSFGNRLPELWEAKEPGESVAFKFTGTTVRIYDLVGPDCGQVTIAVDDRPPFVTRRFDAYCTYHRLATLTVAEGLPEGVHSVRITTNPEQPDKAKILSERVERMDDPKRFDGTVWYAGAILVLGDLAN